MAAKRPTSTTGSVETTKVKPTYSENFDKMNFASTLTKANESINNLNAQIYALKANITEISDTNMFKLKEIEAEYADKLNALKNDFAMKADAMRIEFETVQASNDVAIASQRERYEAALKEMKRLHDENVYTMKVSSRNDVLSFLTSLANQNNKVVVDKNEYETLTSSIEKIKTDAEAEKAKAVAIATNSLKSTYEMEKMKTENAVAIDKNNFENEIKALKEKVQYLTIDNEKKEQIIKEKDKTIATMNEQMTRPSTIVQSGK